MDNRDNVIFVVIVMVFIMGVAGAVLLSQQQGGASETKKTTSQKPVNNIKPTVSSQSAASASKRAEGSQGQSSANKRAASAPVYASQPVKTAAAMSELISSTAAQVAAPEPAQVELDNSNIDESAPENLAWLRPPKLNQDTDGSLIVDSSSRAWLAFFYTVPTNLKPEAEHYKAAVLKKLPVESANKLVELEGQYQQLLDAEYKLYKSYKQFGIDNEIQLAMQGQAHDDEAWDKVLDMVAIRRQVRQNVLGEDLASAWFDEEEAKEEYTMGALSIERSSSLTKQEKARKLAKLDLMSPNNVPETLTISLQRDALVEAEMP